MKDGQWFPRIQGSAFEHEGKWTWELKISFGDADPLFMSPDEKHKGFANRDEALKDLKEHANGVSKKIGETLGTELTGFMNMKTNTFQKELTI